jgi:hypothetical protein
MLMNKTNDKAPFSLLDLFIAYYIIVYTKYCHMLRGYFVKDFLGFSKSIHIVKTIRR